MLYILWSNKFVFVNKKNGKKNGIFFSGQENKSKAILYKQTERVCSYAVGHYYYLWMVYGELYVNEIEREQMGFSTFVCMFLL